MALQQAPGCDSEGSVSEEQPPLVSQAAVQAFVASAIGAEGWEPALSVKGQTHLCLWFVF